MLSCAILNAIFLVKPPKSTQFNFESNCDCEKSFPVWAFDDVLCQGQTQKPWVFTLLLPASVICKAEGAWGKKLLLQKKRWNLRCPPMQNGGCCSSLWVHVKWENRHSPALVSIKSCVEDTMKVENEPFLGCPTADAEKEADGLGAQSTLLI